MHCFCVLVYHHQSTDACAGERERERGTFHSNTLAFNGAVERVAKGLQGELIAQRYPRYAHRSAIRANDALIIDFICDLSPVLPLCIDLFDLICPLSPCHVAVSVFLEDQHKQGVTPLQFLGRYLQSAQTVITQRGRATAAVEHSLLEEQHKKKGRHLLCSALLLFDFRDFS